MGNRLSLNGERGAEGINILLIIEGQLKDNQTFSIVSSTTPFPIFTLGLNQFITTIARDNNCNYSGSYIKSGQVELVKFDGVARIAAGRFAFVLYEPGGFDTLRVTNGRFDVKF